MRDRSSDPLCHELTLPLIYVPLSQSVNDNSKNTPCLLVPSNNMRVSMDTAIVYHKGFFFLVKKVSNVVSCVAGAHTCTNNIHAYAQHAQT